MSNNLINYFLTNLKNDDFKKANPEIKQYDDIHFGCKIVSPLLNDAITESVYDDLCNALTINVNKIKDRKIKKIVKKNNSRVMDYITSYKKEMENYHEELFDDRHCCKCHRVIYMELIKSKEGLPCCVRCGKNEYGYNKTKTNRELRDEKIMIPNKFAGWNKIKKSKKVKKDKDEKKKMSEEIERLKREIEKLKSQS